MVRSGTALAGFWNVRSECKADKAAHRKLVVADVDLLPWTVSRERSVAVTAHLHPGTSPHSPHSAHATL